MGGGTQGFRDCKIEDDDMDLHLQELELGMSVASDNSLINKNTKDKNNMVSGEFILNNNRKL